MVVVFPWESAEGLSRVIPDADATRANSVKLFKELNWLPVHFEVKINISTQVYKRINGQSPSYVNELLILNSDKKPETVEMAR